jgi:signal transduction histidine kinase
MPSAESHAASDERRHIESLATFAHELRNRLQVILHAAQSMQAVEPLVPAVACAGALIARQAAQIGGIVEDLLDAGRSATGKLRLRSERVDLSSVVHLAVETCQPVLAAAAHQLVVRLPSSPVYVHGDSLRLTQVVVNLVDNAAKYSQRNGRITVVLERQAGHGVVRVEDEGLGIAHELLPRIFDLFMQAGDTETTGFQGLGIGLNLVKRIVDLHGGSVDAKSAGPGRGSVFTVCIPADAPAANAGLRTPVGGTAPPGGAS